MHSAGDLEKPAVGDPGYDERIAAMPIDQRKSILWRVDVRLVATLGLLYCISLIDRANLGVASVAGMQEDLAMNSKNNAYSIVTLVFFITYTIFQAPATIFIRSLGPRLFLSTIVVLWGAVMIGFGFVPNWQVMAGLRLILGLLEAGFYPGSVYLLSTWYTRYELQKRNAGFYLIGSMASGFGGILAYGITQMDNIASLQGWRWIFIVEGLLTCVLGALSYFIIVDFPEQSSKSWNFLNEDEAAYVVARIEHDRADTFTEPFKMRAYLQHFGDSKIWAFSALYMLTTTNTYAIAYFMPIILQKGMGFGVAKSQCLSAPPYVAAAIVMYVQAIYGDKYRKRGPLVAFNALLGCVGLAMMGFLKQPGPRYFGVFLATIAGNANCPALLTYQSNNIRGQWKRALASATLVGGGSIGGIIGSTVFRAQDAPNYYPGIEACLIANALIVVIVVLLSASFHMANKRVGNGGTPIEGLHGFKYTI